ncbi:hypothetical protein ABBQ38_003487 [Trebouxia sp. C0009 RCD-2024]
MHVVAKCHLKKSSSPKLLLQTVAGCSTAATYSCICQDKMIARCMVHKLDGLTVAALSHKGVGVQLFNKTGDGFHAWGSTKGLLCSHRATTASLEGLSVL